MLAYMRKLNAALKKHTGRELPIGTCPLTFASWMGGDRDGNPKVTAQVLQPCSAGCNIDAWSCQCSIECGQKIPSEALPCVACQTGASTT